MDTEIDRLRAQAAKARRLLTATSDRITRKQLTDYAEECDDQADRLEAAKAAMTGSRH